MVCGWWVYSGVGVGGWCCLMEVVLVMVVVDGGLGGWW